MRAPFFKIWTRISASYWLLPGLILIGVVVLAQISLEIDSRVDTTVISALHWIRIEDPASAQTILSTIAASMITVTGAVFSITIVALTVAANQFGQRLLRNFMRNRGNQITLGVFLGTFVYALFIMRRVSTLSDLSEVPAISVFGALVLAIASVVVLIYFIHHIATSIQVENVMAAVSDDFNRSLDTLYPQTEKAPSAQAALPRAAAMETIVSDSGEPITAPRAGYVQVIDYDQLVEWAEQNDALLQVCIHPGTFLFEHSVMALVHNNQDSGQGDRASIREAFVIGDQATHEQDIAYSLRQLAQIGVRALSPGINDPFTAYLCINRLGAALSKLLRTTFPPATVKGEDGTPRVVYCVASFANLTSVALDEIIEYSQSSTVVTVYILQMIGVLAKQCIRQADRLVLWQYAKRCAQSNLQNAPGEAAVAEVENKLSQVRSELFAAGEAEPAR